MVGAAVLVQNEQLLPLGHPTHHTENVWGSPGVALKPGETLEDTARRVLLEETGRIANDLTPFDVFAGPALCYCYADVDDVHIVAAVHIRSN